ncbi:MAG: GatB/YqeY domain-containing protein [Firmicutes bacterium]|nr:GatB/YqeY domain-containing protein [Bacillota bacterium]
MNDKIAIELKDAMKSGDKFKLSVLRMLKSAIQLESISKKHDLTDEEVIAVIKKQVKTRKDSITEFEKYNRLDEVEKLQQEIEILNVYLPEEMTEEEITKVIDEVFDIVKPTSMKDMGLIMKELNGKLTNADMSLVSKLVKERLS